MKSVINEKQDVKIEKPFPKLMRSINTNSVVLFKDNKKGTIIFETASSEHLGYFCGSWDMDVFTDFEGEIALSND